MSSLLHAAADAPDRRPSLPEPHSLSPIAETPITTTPPSAASQHVDETEKHFRRRFRKALALVILFSLVDVILIKTTWDQVLQQPQIVSWLLAIVTGLCASALMWQSGAQAASGRVFKSFATQLMACGALVAWLGLGAGLFWLRWNAAALAGSAIQTEGQSTTDPATHTHRVMAIVMIFVYLAPGILAWIDGYLLSHPIEARQRRNCALRHSLTKQLSDKEAESSRIRNLLHQNKEEIDLVPAQAALAKQANAALAAELRSYARQEILRRLGTPNAAGITHPDAQPAATREAPERHDTRGTYPSA